MSFPRLKKRRSFLATATSNQRFRCGAFLLQSKQSSQNDEIGFGFTATRRLGKAVQRNRAKRRLKAAVECACQEGYALAQERHVLIARPEIFTLPFNQLVFFLKKGLFSCVKEKTK